MKEEIKKIIRTPVVLALGINEDSKKEIDMIADEIISLFLQSLPEEQILHEYMKEEFNYKEKMENSDFWRGRNSYRNDLFLKLK